MNGWQRGRSRIDEMLASGQLELITGASANGAPWLAKARRRLDTSTVLAADDPESALVLAYEAAHAAGFGLLAQQGLRPTRNGGHIAVEQALRAQFGGPFDKYGWLRSARNEDLYPAFPGDRIDAQTLVEALADSADILNAAEQLLQSLRMLR